MNFQNTSKFVKLQLLLTIEAFKKHGYVLYFFVTAEICLVKKTEVQAPHTLYGLLSGHFRACTFLFKSAFTTRSWTPPLFNGSRV